MPLASILYYIFCDLSTVFWRGKVTPPARTTSKNRVGVQMEQPTAPTTTATPHASHNGKGNAATAKTRRTSQINAPKHHTRTHTHTRAHKNKPPHRQKVNHKRPFTERRRKIAPKPGKRRSNQTEPGENRKSRKI